MRPDRSVLNWSLALLFSFLWQTSLVAQTASWLVRDLADWRPLGGVEVLMVGHDTVSLGKTDSEGRISLQTEGNPNKKIWFTLPGYQAKAVIWAANQPPDQLVLLEPVLFSFEEVVFTANKFRESREDIPQPIQVVRRQEIELNNPANSAELLEQAGVFVQRSQVGGGSPVLRGFEANRVLIVVDGVRMNNAIYRSGHLQNVITIDPDMIERTEVLFGPGSVMYGSDALGGVMHFYTRQPELSTTGEMRFSMNSYARVASATGETSLHYDANLGFRKWGVITSLSWREFGDLRIGSRDPALPLGFSLRDSLIERVGTTDRIVANPNPRIMAPSGYQQLDLFQKWYFVPSTRWSHTVNLQFSSSSDIPRYDRLVVERNGRLRFAEWYYGPQDRALLSYRLLHSPVNSRWADEWILTAAFQDIRESRHDRAFQSPWLSSRSEAVQVASVNLDARNELPGHHELAYGLEGFMNWVSSSAQALHIVDQSTRALDTRYPDGGTTVASAAAYATHRWEISPRWILSDAIRLNTYYLRSVFIDKQFFPFPEDEILQQNQALSGNLGLVHLAAHDWRVAALVSTGFRAPNLDDIAKVFDSQPGNVVVPNPGLKPEYTYQGELTVGKKWGNVLQAELNGWYTHYDDAIVVRDFRLGERDSIEYAGVMSRVQANVNAERARILGVTQGVRLNWAGLQVRHQVTWTYGQELSGDVPLDHIPPLFGQADVRYSLGRWQWMSRVSYQGWKPLDRLSPREEEDADFATAEGWPAFVAWDLGATYTLSRHFRLQLGIDNVLDQHYRPFSSRISAPGRNIWVAIRVKR